MGWSVEFNVHHVRNLMTSGFRGLAAASGSVGLAASSEPHSAFATRRDFVLKRLYGLGENL